MSVRRCVVLCVSAALMVPSAGAMAAKPKPKPKPKPMCQQITDAKGDEVVTRIQPHAQRDAALDLVSGDIATNATTMTIAIRLNKLAVPAASSPASTYRQHFKVDGKEFYALVAVLPGSQTYADMGTMEPLPGAGIAVGHPAGTATGVVDLPKNEVRISVPLSLFAGVTFTKGVTKIAPTELSAGRGFHERVIADDALAGKEYAHQAPSCVVVGK